MILVGTVFLVQNNFYAGIYVRSQAQENARAMKNVVESEIRAAAAGGVTTADSSRVVLRSNMAMGVVCGSQVNDVVVYFPSSSATLDTAQVGGYAHRSPRTGAWAYHNYSWSQLKVAGSGLAAICAARGADTTGASGDFYRLAFVDDEAGFALPLSVARTDSLMGSAVMLYRRTEFRFNASSLVSGDRALYWGLEGGTLRELVTGMATTAHFEFRTGTNTWSKSVNSGTVASINGIRVVSNAIGKGSSSDQATYGFNLTADIPLSNAY